MLGRNKQQFGIDLGTSNTVIYQQGRGIVLQEPSVIAIWKDTQEIEAYGEQAKAMIGRTSANLEVFYPLKEGVIANFDLTVAMLKYFIGKIKGESAWFGISQIIISVPCGITSIQKRAIEKMVLLNGAGKAVFVEEPLAAALGEGLPVDDPTGCMILNVGGGTVQTALISMGGIVSSQFIPIGGMSVDLEIMEHVKNNHNLIIGKRTAEEFKIKAALAMRSNKDELIEIKGRDFNEGLPKAIVIMASELKGVIEDFITTILIYARQAMDTFSPELTGDLLERGILLCGGGSLLPGLNSRLQDKLGVPVHMAESPLECVALGAGKLLNNQPGETSRELVFARKYKIKNWFKLMKENKPA
jgi:rod shape-determining protein MreB